VDRNDQPPDRPTPTLAEPSYAVQVLHAAADRLDQTPGRVLTPAAWRRQFTLAVATTLHELPDPVVRQSAATAWATLPADPAGATYGEWAAQLRRVAGAV
jgi:hypothetical protein